MFFSLNHLTFVFFFSFLFFPFYFKMNHVLMYTHDGSLSSFLETTQGVYKNWVVSGLVGHI